MRRIVIESPFAAKTPALIEARVAYARRCVRDALKRGDAPIASHLLFTQPGILKDEIPAERSLGMRAGFAWTAVAEAVVVYIDHGISAGMKAGIAQAKKHHIPVEYRSLTDDELTPSALALLLLQVGIDADVRTLTDAAPNWEAVLEATKWARAKVLHDAEPTEETPPAMPSWLGTLPTIRKEETP